MKILKIASLIIGVSPALALAEIIVGVTLSTTGPAASLGVPERNTIALLGETLGGEPVRYIILDDASDPTTAAKNAQRLITENNADVLIGSTTFPGARSVAAVAAQHKIPQIALAPDLPPATETPWTFSVPQTAATMTAGVVEHMAKNGIKTVGYVGFADSLGDSFYSALVPLAKEKGIEIVATEKYARGDRSALAQVTKIIAANPDAIFIGASGTPAALPMLNMAERNYSVQVYTTPGAVGDDFLRVGGKAVEGTIAPTGLISVADQLPDTNPSKEMGTTLAKLYNAQHGSGGQSPFAGYAYDSYLLLNEAVPKALEAGKPGTAAFRSALRDALENTQDVVGTHGIYNYSATEHNSVDPRSRALVQVKDGEWKVVE